MITRCINIFVSLVANILCCSLFVSAQYPQIFFTHHNTRDGLSNNVCKSIIRDSEGYAWIATSNGLNRFDGYRFEIFRNVPGDSTSLRSNEVYAVHEDANGNIWAGQSGVVSRFNKDSHSFSHYENIPGDDKSFSGGQAVDFFNDREGNLWIATIGGGLNLYLPKENSFRYFKPDKPNSTNIKNSVWDISEDDKGNLWLASYDGLCKFSKQNKKFDFFIYKPEDIANRSYNNLCLSVLCDESDKNLVWYGTWGSGLHCYNKRNNTTDAYIYIGHGAMNLTNIVSEIYARDEHTLWVGTEKGLAIFNKQTHEFFFYTHETENPNSLSGTGVSCIFRDKQNALWVATENGVNIAIAAMQNFSVISLHGASGSQLIHDVKEKKIYGVRNYDKRSLFIYDEKTQTQKTFPIPHADEMRSEPFGFFRDSHGKFWIGCVKTGIYLFDTSTFSFTKLETEKYLKIKDIDLNIRAIKEDAEENIWVASYTHGMIKYNLRTKLFRRFSDDNIGSDHLPFTGCSKIGVDVDGNVFGFFENTGICIIDKKTGTIQSYDFKKDKRYRMLETMSDAAMDEKGRLWISTATNGLVLFDWQQQDEKRLSFFNTSKQFPDNNLGSLTFDDEQNLWIAGSDGIIFFDTKNFTSKIYTEHDGLYRYTPSVTLMNAHNGEIWFPVPEGYCSFNPKTFRLDTTNYTIVLNSLKVFDKELFPKQNIDAIKSIELNHEQNFISVEFAASCFSNPGGIKYAYMLDRFDADWHYCGNRRYASYTDIKPGNYTLKIKAANADGRWNEIEKSLLIIIHPAWWQTIWFKIILAALTIILTVIGFRIFSQMKIRKLERALLQQKEVQEIRNRIARDIHDEIGSGLTKISVMSSKLQTQKNNSADEQQLSEKIQKTSRDVIESLGEIVWTVNSKNDSFVNMLSYIRQYAGKYFDATTIKHKVEIIWASDEQQHTEVNPEIKRNLLMIVKEALNNIVKHSSASACEIVIHIDKKFIHLKVNDNGKGFQQGETLGNGLKNMQKRAEEVFGSFTMASNENTGTTISVSIPFN